MVADLKKNYRTLLLITLIVVAFFGSDWIMEYATDTYATISLGWKGVAKDAALRNGRIVMAFFYYLAYLLNISVKTFYLLSYVLAIICLILSIYIYEELINKKIKSKLTSIVISVAILINPFVIEYFMFLEKGLFFLAMLLTIVSVNFYLCYTEKRNKSNLFISVAILLLATFTYQGITAMFVCCLTPFLLINNKEIKNKIANLFYCGFAWAMCGLINIVFMKLISNSTRINEGVNYLGKVYDVVTKLPLVLFDTLSILPKGIYIFILAVVVIMFINNVKNKNKYIDGLLLAMIVIGTSVSSILLGSGWWAARIIYPLLSLVSLICLLTILNNKKANVVIVLVILLFVQLFSFQRIIVDKHKNSALDQYRTAMLGIMIEDYEKETGIEIKNISIYNDDITAPQYEGLFLRGSLVLSSYSREWSDTDAVNYYLNRNLIEVENKESITKKFKNIKEKAFSSKQVVFEGDTLHLLVY